MNFHRWESGYPDKLQKPGMIIPGFFYDPDLSLLRGLDHKKRPGERSEQAFGVWIPPPRDSPQGKSGIYNSYPYLWLSK